MIKNTIITLIIITAIACNNNSNEQNNTTENTPAPPKTIPIAIGTNLSDSTFQTEVGWGYDIKMNGKTYIHQPHIPSVGGNQGFSTQEKAQKAASFVKYKIENNIMPPSVSPAELDSIGVLD